MFDVVGIFLRCHQITTGSGAAFDLILQTRAGPVTEKGVLALPYLEYLLQDIEGVPDAVSRGKRAKVAPFLLLSAAMECQSRIFVFARKVDVRVRFVIPKNDVVGRSKFFNQ